MCSSKKKKEIIIPLEEELLSVLFSSVFVGSILLEQKSFRIRLRSRNSP